MEICDVCSGKCHWSYDNSVLHTKNQGRRSNGSNRIAQPNKQTNGQTNRRYQVHYNIPCFAKSTCTRSMTTRNTLPPPKKKGNSSLVQLELKKNGEELFFGQCSSDCSLKFANEKAFFIGGVYIRTHAREWVWKTGFSPVCSSSTWIKCNEGRRFFFWCWISNFLAFYKPRHKFKGAMFKWNEVE